ncbi:MAG TPA: tetratricopeptide repeat protein [Holophagaceae bacterium]
MWTRFRTAYRLLAALCLAALLAAALLLGPAPSSRTGLLASLLGGLLLGMGLRAWLSGLWGRRCLHRAEVAWASGNPVETVLHALPRRIRVDGELGYRIELLRGAAHLAKGERDQAWTDHLEAQLGRLPLWRRLLVAPYFHQVPSRPTDRRLAWGDRLIRLAPTMARLRHLQGILLLRRATDAFLPRAWERFAEALPLAGEDPMILEDLMLAGFHHGQEDLALRALRQLLDRHGDPRLGWDRTAPALHLLRNERWSEALALVASLPPGLRVHPVHWLAESVSRRRLGDPEGAWRTVEAAVTRLPDAFRLWMERYQIALERREVEDALRSLERAWDLIPGDGDGQAMRDEWHLRRSEFAFWWEDDPGFAWELLAKVPPERQGDHHPPLPLQLRVALGEYEEAYREVAERLASRPGDLDLLMLQADCLAGLEAWEALPPYLDGLGEAARSRPAFWHLRGLALANLGDPAPARVDLERAARMDPHHVRYLLDAGHACAELGEWERAENHWRQALQVDGQSEEALIQLAEARRELQDPEGSRRYLRECLLHHPESQEAQTRLAELEAN